MVLTSLGPEESEDDRDFTRLEHHPIDLGTLAVMAEAQRLKTPGRPVLAAMDAKRNEIYLQAFDADGYAFAQEVSQPERLVFRRRIAT